MKLFYFLVVLSLTLIGCTTVTETVLKNEKGQIRYCYLHNDHTLISMGAMSEYNKCLNDAGTSGYKKVQ